MSIRKCSLEKTLRNKMKKDTVNKKVQVERVCMSTRTNCITKLTDI